MLSSLLRRMQDIPPVDIVVGAWIQQQKPKPLAEQARSAGLPVKKGKVKRRGNLSR
ncbi:MAG: hypothetical protein UMS36scaffold28_23 [Phage 59_13]|nr:MAG: hypothetical protein UMS36scaffold28_23 [Phage 59_13]